MKLIFEGTLHGEVVFVEGHEVKFLGKDASDIEHLWGSLKSRYNVDDQTLFKEAPHLLRASSHLSIKAEGYTPNAESTIKRDVV